jgi:hypothetical protein
VRAECELVEHAVQLHFCRAESSGDDFHDLTRLCIERLARRHAKVVDELTEERFVHRGIDDLRLFFWSAVSAEYPEAAHQRCWLHRIQKVLDKVPDKPKGKVHRKLREICSSTTRAEAMSKIDSLAFPFVERLPEGVASTDDVDRMLAYFAFPKASWKSLRTTNPIEPAFASVPLCTNVTKRLRSRASALYLVFKLIERLSTTWRRINGYQTIAFAQKKVALDNACNGLRRSAYFPENRRDLRRLSAARQLRTSENA